MAKLKTTYISGGLFVTGSENFVSASEFRGDVVGTASVAQNLDPEANLRVQTLDVSGSAVVGGDLKVLGDLTYVGVQDLRVKDKTIELNADDSGSAVASADGAGIIIRDSGSADITITYDKDVDQIVFSKPISGSIAQAEKTKFALHIGEGLVQSGSSFDGHEAVTVSLDTASVKAVKVNSASRADSAAEADKVANKLTVSSDKPGRLSISADYDGSSAETISLDLSDIEDSISNVAATASAELTSLSESVAESIENLESGSAEALSNFSASVATDFSASNAARVALSESVATSISESNAARVALSESVAQDLNDFSASVADDFTANASASTAALNDFSASVATDFSASAAARTDLSKSVATSISESNAARVALSESVAQDLNDFSASVADDFTAEDTKISNVAATASAEVTALSESVASSSNAFSASVATDFSASAAHVDTVSASLAQAIEDLESGSSDNYVKKAGDTMTGDLNMAGNGVKFGDMIMKWNSTDECIEFITDTE